MSNQPNQYTVLENLHLECAEVYGQLAKALEELESLRNQNGDFQVYIAELEAELQERRRWDAERMGSRNSTSEQEPPPRKAVGAFQCSGCSPRETAQTERNEHVNLIPHLCNPQLLHHPWLHEPGICRGPRFQLRPVRRLDVPRARRKPRTGGRKLPGR